MKKSENYKLLDHAGKVIAMGTQAQIFSYVKHHVPDGVVLKAQTEIITLGELFAMVVCDPPFGD